MEENKELNEPKSLEIGKKIGQHPSFRLSMKNPFKNKVIMSPHLSSLQKEISKENKDLGSISPVGKNSPISDSCQDRKYSLEISPTNNSKKQKSLFYQKEEEINIKIKVPRDDLMEDYITVKKFMSFPQYAADIFLNYECKQAFKSALKIATKLNSNHEVKKALQSIDKKIENNKMETFLNPNLNPKLKKRLIILDIEGVLASTTTVDPKTYDFKLIIEKRVDFKFQLYVTLRPFVKQFLNDISSKFSIVLYANLQESTIKRIISSIDENAINLIDCILDSNYIIEYIFPKRIKSLKVFQQWREIKDIVAINCTTYSFSMDVLNEILIKEYDGDPNDSELPKVGQLLENLSQYEDMQKYIALIRRGINI